MGGIVVFIGIHHGNGSLQQTVVMEYLSSVIQSFANLIQAGFADELGEILLAAEDGIFEAGIDKGIAVSLETLVDNFENTDALFGRNVFHVGLQHLLSYNSLHFGEGDGRKILVGGNLQTVGGGFYPGFILAFRAETRAAVLGIRMKSSPVPMLPEWPADDREHCGDASRCRRIWSKAF